MPRRRSTATTQGGGRADSGGRRGVANATGREAQSWQGGSRAERWPGGGDGRRTRNAPRPSARRQRPSPSDATGRTLWKTYGRRRPPPGLRLPVTPPPNSTGDPRLSPGRLRPGRRRRLADRHSAAPALTAERSDTRRRAGGRTRGLRDVVRGSEPKSTSPGGIPSPRRTRRLANPRRWHIAGLHVEGRGASAGPETATTIGDH